MSMACKCDRCGVLYEYDYQNYINSYFIGKERFPCADKKLDLCPNCQKKLVEWFKDVERNEEK